MTVALVAVVSGGVAALLFGWGWIAGYNARDRKARDPWAAPDPRWSHLRAQGRREV